LYGPGTTACWYLIALSVFISWTIHLKKRTTGSIDSDFIALLTLPAVAAGHLISQIHTYSGRYDEMITTEDKFLGEYLAAIEASLNITENFFPIALILCSLAILFRNVRRAILVSLIGSFGFSAEGYLFFTTRSPPYTEYKQGNFTRPFLISIASTMLAAVGVLVVFGVSNIGILLSFYFKRMAVRAAATPSTNRPVDRETVGVAAPSN